eukprot:CAMPEP_0174879980 /NCGR_PEP_ID=MMETSP1114-20130205/83530_1 /TAXON_ID=312471 /ORGANISM="Neobodo designis, Strain CCAP 1951/1" /LENGTH=499 /DNA_ID=CAMNT_0016115375 /DNA_START=154 /DNA_END=1653 /DNA_ORIENTATION=-
MFQNEAAVLWSMTQAVSLPATPHISVHSEHPHKADNAHDRNVHLPGVSHDPSLNQKFRYSDVERIRIRKDPRVAPIYTHSQLARCEGYSHPHSICAASVAAVAAAPPPVARLRRPEREAHGVAGDALAPERLDGVGRLLDGGHVDESDGLVVDDSDRRHFAESAEALAHLLLRQLGRDVADKDDVARRVFAARRAGSAEAATAATAGRGRAAAAGRALTAGELLELFRCVVEELPVSDLAVATHILSWRAVKGIRIPTASVRIVAAVAATAPPVARGTRLAERKAHVVPVDPGALECLDRVGRLLDGAQMHEADALARDHGGRRHVSERAEAFADLLFRELWRDVADEDDVAGRVFAARRARSVEAATAACGALTAGVLLELFRRVVEVLPVSDLAVAAEALLRRAGVRGHTLLDGLEVHVRVAAVLQELHIEHLAVTTELLRDESLAETLRGDVADEDGVGRLPAAVSAHAATPAETTSTAALIVLHTTTAPLRHDVV